MEKLISAIYRRETQREYDAEFYRVMFSGSQRKTHLTLRLKDDGVP